MLVGTPRRLLLPPPTQLLALYLAGAAAGSLAHCGWYFYQVCGSTGCRNLPADAPNALKPCCLASLPRSSARRAVWERRTDPRFTRGHLAAQPCHAKQTGTQPARLGGGSVLHRGAGAACALPAPLWAEPRPPALPHPRAHHPLVQACKTGQGRYGRASWFGFTPSALGASAAVNAIVVVDILLAPTRTVLLYGASPSPTPDPASGGPHRRSCTAWQPVRAAQRPAC